jgi:hypothetical protein
MSVDPEAFYRDVFHELDEFIHRRTATAAGAAVAVKRVAMAHGLEVADRLPLPRLNRAELAERGEADWRAHGWLLPSVCRLRSPHK